MQLSSRAWPGPPRPRAAPSVESSEARAPASRATSGTGRLECCSSVKAGTTGTSSTLPRSDSDGIAHAGDRFRRRLLHKAVAEKPLHARGTGCQSSWAQRRRAGPPASDGSAARFRSPPLETIPRPRLGFVQQARREAIGPSKKCRLNRGKPNKSNRPKCCSPWKEQRDGRGRGQGESLSHPRDGEWAENRDTPS